MSITSASTVIITGDQSDDNLRIAMMVNDILKAEHFNNIDILLQVDKSEDLLIARNTFGKRMKIFSSRDFDFDPIFRGFMLKEYLNLYGNLIGVDGDLVVSLIEEKNCIGKTFGEIINGFIYSDVIGLVTEEQIILNPDKQTLIQDTHKLILLAPVDTDPHYIEPPKSYVPQIVESSQNLNFIRETVETVLLIGNDSENLLTERIESQYPEIKLLNVKTISPIKTLIKEIDGIMTSQSPDIVVFMDSETEDYDRSDDLFLKLSAYMDSKYNRKENNYVIATYMHSSQNTKFVYELDYIDMVFNNDNNRRMALRTVDRTNRIQRVEQKLLEAGDRIGAVLAADITGTDEKQLADVYRDCVEHDLILVGYIIREGGFINVKLNPGKNDRIRFDNDDLLLVLK